MTSAVKTFVDSRKKIITNEPITDSHQAANTIFTCEACQGSFKLM